MISEQVIKEIYKTNPRPPKNPEDLRLNDVLPLLSEHHQLSVDNADLSKAEIIINNLEEANPFRRFLVRSLHAVLDFDKMVAFVFKNHILFLGKEDGQLRVHFKPEDDRNIFSRIFGR